MSGRCIIVRKEDSVFYENCIFKEYILDNKSKCTSGRWSLDDVRALLERSLTEPGFDVNVADGQGKTLLRHAVELGLASDVWQLLEAGANVDAVHGGETPLMVAAQNGCTNTMRVLLEAGANANACSSYRRMTPLMFAVQCGHEDAVRLLLDAGADINAIDRYGKLALTYAVERGFHGVEAVLRERGAIESVWDYYFQANEGSALPEPSAPTASPSPSRQQRPPLHDAFGVLLTCFFLGWGIKFLWLRSLTFASVWEQVATQALLLLFGVVVFVVAAYAGAGLARTLWGGRRPESG